MMETTPLASAAPRAKRNARESISCSTAASRQFVAEQIGFGLHPAGEASEAEPLIKDHSPASEEQQLDQDWVQKGFAIIASIHATLRQVHFPRSRASHLRA